jgi:hypothetical protein
LSCNRDNALLVRGIPVWKGAAFDVNCDAAICLAYRICSEVSYRAVGRFFVFVRGIQVVRRLSLPGAASGAKQPVAGCRFLGAKPTARTSHFDPQQASDLCAWTASRAPAFTLLGLFPIGSDVCPYLARFSPWNYVSRLALC